VRELAWQWVRQKEEEQAQAREAAPEMVTLKPNFHGRRYRSQGSRPAYTSALQKIMSLGRAVVAVRLLQRASVL
jgi:hypothetical protein